MGAEHLAFVVQTPIHFASFVLNLDLYLMEIAQSIPPLHLFGLSALTLRRHMWRKFDIKGKTLNTTAKTFKPSTRKAIVEASW
jgi:hypothetical protein